MSPVATLLLLLFLSGVAAANPRPLREWCTTQGATVLEAGEPFPDDFECEIRGVVGIGGSHTFELETFPVKDGDPQTDLILELRTIKGTASLEVIGPTDYWRDSHMDALRVPGMLYIIIPRTTLADHPGKYVINIVGASDKPTYKLTVRTSSVDVLLKGGHATARESSTQQTEDGGYNETALLREVYNSCCALFDNEGGEACQMLHRALDPASGWQDDICQQPPNQCDHEGYLRRLVLVGGVSGNFICLKFPKEFGQFKRLEVLDLSNNFMIGGLEDVAESLGELKTLKQLYLSVNNFEGPIPCDFFFSHDTLEVVWLGWNAIMGRIPSCVTLGIVVRELVLSENYLLGTLPELLDSSPLEMIDVSNNGDFIFIGIIGTIPSSWMESPRLTFIDVSRNNISGAFPQQLPESSQVFICESNRLSSTLPQTFANPPRLRALLAGGNKITGSLPQSIKSAAQLEYLELQDNQMTGSVVVPNSEVNSHFRGLDLSNNKFSGPLPHSLASSPIVHFIKLGGNRLDGSLEAFGEALPQHTQDELNNRLMVLNVTGNLLTGSLSGSFEKLGMFHLGNEMAAGKVILDVSMNKLDGDFPVWIFESLKAVTEDQLRGMKVLISQQANGSLLECPSLDTIDHTLLVEMAANHLLIQLSFLYKLKCRSVEWGDIYISDALSRLAKTLPESQPNLGSSGEPSNGSEGGGGGTNGTLIGVIAGVSAAAICLLLAALYLLHVRRAKKADEGAARATAATTARPTFYNNPLSSPEVPTLGLPLSLADNLGNEGIRDARPWVGVQADTNADASWYQKFGKMLGGNSGGVFNRGSSSGGSSNGGGGRGASGSTGARAQWTSNFLFTQHQAKGGSSGGVGDSEKAL